MHNSQFPAFCIFALFQEDAGVFRSAQIRVEEDFAFSVLVLVSTDLMGVLLLFEKNCLLEQAHQDVQVIERPYQDSWCTYVCIIASVLARLGKFCKHAARETQAAKIYQDNKHMSETSQFLKCGLRDLKCEKVAFVLL